MEAYLQTLVHDHDITFYNYDSAHQECLAHVLRYLQNAIENEPDLTWHKDMKTLISGCIHDAKQDRNFSDKRIQEIEDEYDKILRNKERTPSSIPCTQQSSPGTYNYTRLVFHPDEMYSFLPAPEMQPGWFASPKP